MTISIALFALGVSILSLLYSVSSIRVSMFKERYQIFTESREMCYKLIGDWHAVSNSITQNDLNKIENLTLKSTFLFDNDEKVINFLNQLKTDLAQLFNNSWNVINETLDGHEKQNRFVEANSVYRQNLERFESTLIVINDIFKRHLLISYCPLNIYNWYHNFNEKKLK